MTTKQAKRFVLIAGISSVIVILICFYMGWYALIRSFQILE
jgi:hypothetical protein